MTTSRRTALKATACLGLVAAAQATQAVGLPPPPARSDASEDAAPCKRRGVRLRSGSSDGWFIAACVAGLGGYYWWKRRQ